MAETISRDDIIRMLRGAIARILAGHETLSKLDSVIGDGDHGTTMVRAMGLVEKSVVQSAAPDLKGMLSDVGWAVMGVDGGAAGPLIGSLLMGMAEAVGDRQELDAAGVAAMFEGGLAKVRTYSQAQVGDKTMLDALVPAIETLRAAVTAGDGIVAAMCRGAEAAEKGAASTVDLVARFGRARNLGERSRGFADPGATSISLIFHGFADALV
jgi:dihydroxyacetone kinase-like protein